LSRLTDEKMSNTKRASKDQKTETVLNKQNY